MSKKQWPLILAVVLAAVPVMAGKKKPAPLALPDYTQAPYRLLVTDGPGRGWSILTGYDNKDGVVDVYVDPHIQARDGEEVVSNIITVFKTADGTEFYAEWKDYTRLPEMVRGYRRRIPDGPWIFDKEKPIPDGQ